MSMILTSVCASGRRTFRISRERSSVVCVPFATGVNDLYVLTRTSIPVHSVWPAEERE